MNGIPCCGNCPHFQRWHDAGDAVGACLSNKPYLTIRDVPYSVIALKGCLHHPNARAYLMKGVVEELEMRITRHPNTIYAKVLQEHISLIKGGVK